MYSKGLSHTQRYEFMQMFYQRIDIEDFDSPTPLGCPWQYEHNIELFGNDIYELVDYYINNYVAIDIRYGLYKRPQKTFIQKLFCLK